MNKKIALTVLTALNVIVAAACGILYLNFTSNMLVTTQSGSNAPTVSIAVGGMQGAIYRYVLYTVAALLLELVMLFFNLSILQYVEADQARANKYCAFIGLAGFGVMVGISAVGSALNM